jgi:hypothetical protein
MKVAELNRRAGVASPGEGFLAESVLSMVEGLEMTTENGTAKSITIQTNTRVETQTLKLYATAARTASMMRASEGPMCASNGGL